MIAKYLCMGLYENVRYLKVSMMRQHPFNVVALHGDLELITMKHIATVVVAHCVNCKASSIKCIMNCCPLCGLRG